MDVVKHERKGGGEKEGSLSLHSEWSSGRKCGRKNPQSGEGVHKELGPWDGRVSKS